jgi:3-phenylpropionate/trans-cinnamate dioxygenase ferredoxin reductase subunit
MEHVAIVGSSLAGLRAAETLRTSGYDGTITVVGAERHLPYDRPPLSKKFLSGEWEVDQIALRKPDALGELDLTFRLGAAAASLETAARTVSLADGGQVHYDGLVIATGASCRRLANLPTLAGIHELRTMDDSVALRADLAQQSTHRRLVVIGAGFIGLEAAATARRAYGCEVTVLEGLPAPLVRALGAEMGSAIAAVHEDHGVHVRCGVHIAGIEGDGTRVTGVRLGTGELIPADVVLVGIGVIPNTGWLEQSGIVLRDGVVCDATLNVGVPGVYAAGDLVRWPNALFGEEMRVEHWTTASEQGAAAAANLLAVSRGEEPTPFSTVPFFWSDQFDARIQYLGRGSGDNEVRVVAGSVAERRFVALYGNKGRLRAALGVSMPKVVMPFRKLLAEQVSWEDALAVAAERAG